MTHIRKAVLPVAGLGSRLFPATKAIPKELLPLVDKPLIDYAIEEARDAGIEEFIFITADGKEAIADHVHGNPALTRRLRANGKNKLAQVAALTLAPGKAHFVRQDQPRGLGHAIWCARDLVGDEPFAVLLPDDVILGSPSCIPSLMSAHAVHGGNMAAVVEVPREETKRYGILDIASDNGQVARARGLIEKPEPSKAPSTLAIIGRYILSPGIFDELEAGHIGAGGEIQLTDAIEKRLDIEPFHGVRFAGTRYDCGSKEGLLEATVAAALDRDDLHGAMQDILSFYNDKATAA